MTVLTISQDTLIQLPDGATGGAVKLSYNGTTVGPVIASGDDQGRAVIVQGRLAKLTALDGKSPLKVVGREAGGRLPARITISVYPEYPAGVTPPHALVPLMLTGLPVGSPDAPGIWDLSNIGDASGGMDVVLPSERQALAVLRERGVQAAERAEGAAVVAQAAEGAAAQAIANLGSRVDSAAQQAAAGTVARVDKALADTAQTGLRVKGIAEQVQADAANILGAEHVPTRADLAGKPAKTYVIDDENVKLRWDGSGVVPGSESLMLATAAQVERIASRGGDAIYAADYGVHHNNSAEANIDALAALAAAVNAIPNNDGLPIAVEMPAGDIAWSRQIEFVRPVVIWGRMTRIIDLCPAGQYPIVLGPQGLALNSADLTWRGHRHYWATNLIFAGGRTSAGGILWRQGVTMPKARLVTGFDYGNTGAYLLDGEAHNWDTEIVQCDLVATSQNNVGGLVNLRGQGDYGQSRLRLSHCHVSIVSPAPGSPIAIRSTGRYSEVAHSKLEGDTAVHVIGDNTSVVDNYFEVTVPRGEGLPTAPIYYGGDDGAWGVGLTIKDCYANLHHTDLAMPPAAHFAAPIKPGVGLQHARIYDNIAGDSGPLTQLIYQYDLMGQIGNRSRGNRRANGRFIPASVRTDWLEEPINLDKHAWRAGGSDLTWDGWALSGPGSLKLRSVQGNVRDLRWDETLNGGKGGFKSF